MTVAAIDVRRRVGQVPEINLIPLDRLAAWAVVCGIPTAELTALWRVLAADGASPAVVSERVCAALRGDVVKFMAGLPRPRIF